MKKNEIKHDAIYMKLRTIMKNKLNMKRDKGWKTKYKFCVIDSII